MTDEILLTADDFKPYRDISENIDFERLSPWILEAQKQEMRTFLGPALYLAMITDYDGSAFVDPRFVDLWEGVDVPNKYRFYGLKPVIIYFAYSRFLKNQQTVVTRYGVKHLTRDESEDAGAASLRTRLGESQSMAVSLQNDVEKFISDHRSQYPEFEFSSANANQKNIYIPVSRGGRSGVL